MPLLTHYLAGDAWLDVNVRCVRVCACVCVCVCECVRERERERVCVCVVTRYTRCQCAGCGGAWRVPTTGIWNGVTKGHSGGVVLHPRSVPGGLKLSKHVRQGLAPLTFFNILRYIFSSAGLTLAIFCYVAVIT